MKLFKRLLLILLVLVALIAIVSQVLPGHYRVERSTVIAATPDAIFPQINAPKNWNNWSAWNPASYPDMQQTFTGPESGVGATSTWDGKSTGQGTYTITQSDPARGIAYDLAMEHGSFRSKGEFAFTPGPDGTRVVWSDEGDLSRNPMHRIVGLFLDKMLGPDFEKGLANLKTQLEQPKK